MRDLLYLLYLLDLLDVRYDLQKNILRILEKKEEKFSRIIF